MSTAAAYVDKFTTYYREASRLNKGAKGLVVAALRVRDQPPVDLAGGTGYGLGHIGLSRPPGHTPSRPGETAPGEYGRSGRFLGAWGHPRRVRPRPRGLPCSRAPP